MDMTWGAGGRTSDLTLTLCDKIQNEKVGVRTRVSAFRVCMYFTTVLCYWFHL